MSEQSAAIPYRVRDGRLEVLLVTSRRRKRWVFPKGRVKAGMRPYISAAREAREEAGAIGEPAPALVGTYRQAKTAIDGSVRIITVRAYALSVTSILQVWPEMRERKRKWFDVADAAKAVRDRELRGLIRPFAILREGTG